MIFVFIKAEHYCGTERSKQVVSRVPLRVHASFPWLPKDAMNACWRQQTQ